MKILSGERLRDLRKKYNFSQQFIGDYLSVSRPTYERYEKDIVEIPISKLCELARLYHIDPLEFLSTIITDQDQGRPRYSRNSGSSFGPDLGAGISPVR